MNDNDIVIRLIKLPGSIKGYTSPSVDGIYNVYINQNLPFEMQHQVIRHEIDHIRRRDFESDRNVVELETTMDETGSQGKHAL